MCNSTCEYNVLFYPDPFFPLDFRMEFFIKACTYRGNRPRKNVVKYTDSTLKGKEES
jgi:hypothetical protein